MADARLPGRYLKPAKFEINRDNGCFTWHCRIEEVDQQGNVMQGPVQLHGGDTEHLLRDHGGKHASFLAAVKEKMLRHHDHWKVNHEEAQDLEGKSL